MEIVLRAPAKTFILGEYAVLSHGQALLVNTQPEFALKVALTHGGDCRGIHPQSPAGRWIREHRFLFQELDIEFIDPYEGKGGLGASSAQFLLVYYLQKLLDERGLGQIHQVSLTQLLRDYKNFSHQGKGIEPSGADVLSQRIGGMAFVNVENAIGTTLSWPFVEKDFFIVRTHEKCSTHVHLETLKNRDFSSLAVWVEKGMDSVRNSDWSVFINCIENYRQQLEVLELTSPNTQKLLVEINEWQEIEASKGCGALGSDTLLMFYDSSVKDQVRERLESLKLEVVGDRFTISKGPFFAKSNSLDSMQEL